MRDARSSVPEWLRCVGAGVLLVVLAVTPAIALVDGPVPVKPQLAAPEATIQPGVPKAETPLQPALSQATDRPGPPALGGPVAAKPPVADRDFLPEGTFGYLLADAATGEVLESSAADQLFIPASVAKVPTTLAALEILGPTHRRSTDLLMTGNIAGGVLKGDLILRGGGDPLLTTDDLREMARSLKQSGIGRVEGRYIYDESRFEVMPEVEPSQPEDVHYNAAVGPLSVNFNRLHLDWSPTKDGVRVAVTSQARGGAVPVSNVDFDYGQTRPQDRRRFVYSEAEDGRPKWRLTPGWPRKGRAFVPVKHPGHNGALLFRTIAGQQGIRMPDPEPGAAPAGARMVVSHPSASLATISRLVLKHSNNPAAEMVGQATAEAVIGAPPTPAQAAQITMDWFREREPGVDWDGFFMANGSGLSTASQASPRQVAALLIRAYRNSGFVDYRALLKPMPWSLEDPSQPKGQRQVPLDVRAKTGTMHYARGLAGYVTAKSGRVLVFTFFATDYAQRAAFDADLSRRGPAARGARRWLRRARNFERAMITDWFMRY